MGQLGADDDLRRVFIETEVIAVLGAHTDASRAAHRVPAYLARQGYRIIPVNPGFAGQELWGERVVPTLADLPVAVDMIDVFRRSSALVDHLLEILAMKPGPKVVWFQLGIRNDAVAGRLIEAGIDVVQDRCTLADHRRLGIGRR